jgi:23S rRNA U2552 (ribose-2'-O)-methylase RlmE/FtsJ
MEKGGWKKEGNERHKKPYQTMQTKNRNHEKKMEPEEKQIENLFRITVKCKELPDGEMNIVKKENDLLFPKIYGRISECKCKIDEINIAGYWDKAKRLCNPYEMINSAGTNIIETGKLETDTKPKPKNVRFDSILPLSRSFFKMIEIYDTLGIIPDKYKNKNGKIAYLAEGPGGFLEAVYQKRHVKKLDDHHYGITLKPINKDIPGWTQLHKRKKSFLNKNKVHLFTGDLYKTKTIFDFSNHFRKEKAFLVTCDGGFDCSEDFNNQERNCWKIILCEMVTAFLIQEKKGTLVCKVFDLFTIFSVQIIYILSFLYEDVYIFKPKTSRPANSEKYIVAKKFKGIPKKILEFLVDLLQTWEKNGSISNQKIIIDHLEISKDFCEMMNHINQQIVKQQEESITKTLEYIQKSPDTFTNKNYNIQYDEHQKNIAKEWFKKFKILPKKKLFRGQIA